MNPLLVCFLRALAWVSLAIVAAAAFAGLLVLLSAINRRAISVDPPPFTHPPEPAGRRLTPEFKLALEAAADRLGGRRHDASIVFPAAGRPARIWFYGEGGAWHSACTSVQVDLKGRAAGTLKVVPRGLLARIARLLGAQDLGLGDRSFVVKARPESLARDVFAGGRMADLVRRLASFGPVRLVLAREALTVRVTACLLEEVDIVQFARAAMQAAELILEAETPGVVLGTEGVALPVGRCKVCGSEFRDPVVTCRRCGRPHHEECWVYFGLCSTYACREWRFDRA